MRRAVLAFSAVCCAACGDDQSSYSRRDEFPTWARAYQGDVLRLDRRIDSLTTRIESLEQQLTFCPCDSGKVGR